MIELSFSLGCDILGESLLLIKNRIKTWQKN